MGGWTARQIWNVMPRDERERAALSLWNDDQVERADRARALAPWLVARGLRLQYLEKLPRRRRAVLMAEGGVPEETAEQLLMSLHLVHRRELLAEFLDALGLPHDNGLIDGKAEFDPPAAGKVAAAIAKVRQSHPEARVDLYLRTLAAADPLLWAAVAESIEAPA